MSDAPSERLARRAPRAIARFVLTFVLLLTADLVIKSLSFEHVADAPIALERDANGQLPPIPPHDAVIVIPKVLALQLTLNRGAVFGLGQGGRWFFVGVGLIAVVVIPIAFARSRASQWFLQVVLAAVLAGALGNCYDRLMVGAVRDMFLLFPGVTLPFGWTWGGGADGLYPWLFNLADVCLVVGIIILIILMYRADRMHNAKANDS